MIFRLLRYTDRQAVLEGVRKAKPTLLDGTLLQFFADYSPGTTQERQEYKDIRTKLRQRGIDSFLLYPAILRVNFKGRRMSFNSAAEAIEALKAGGGVQYNKREIFNIVSFNVRGLNSPFKRSRF